MVRVFSFELNMVEKKVLAYFSDLYENGILWFWSQFSNLVVFMFRINF